VSREEPREDAERYARAGLLRRFHAWLLSEHNSKYERIVTEYKRDLLGNLRGDVLEIGPGGGANLPHYSTGIRWAGIEPNVYMHRYLREKAGNRDLPIDLRTGIAEEIGFEDGSFDAVVTTLVLCSVSDLARSLQEILRVLRPGGRFVFIEHVAAPAGSRTRRMQRWIRPLWNAIGDGCRPDRETWTAIDHAGFDNLNIQHFRVPFPIVGPHICGVGVKKSL
jgi:SAM-dependent methyltransferase